MLSRLPGPNGEHQIHHMAMQQSVTQSQQSSCAWHLMLSLPAKAVARTRIRTRGYSCTTAAMQQGMRTMRSGTTRSTTAASNSSSSSRALRSCRKRQHSWRPLEASSAAKGCSRWVDSCSCCCSCFSFAADLLHVPREATASAVHTWPQAVQLQYTLFSHNHSLLHHFSWLP